MNLDNVTPMGGGPQIPPKPAPLRLAREARASTRRTHAKGRHRAADRTPISELAETEHEAARDLGNVDAERGKTSCHSVTRKGGAVMNSRVVPIRMSGEEPPETPPKKPRLLPRRKGLLLSESSESEGYSTLDLVNGLHGVCEALDSLPGAERSIEQYCELSMAAKIISSILQRRVEI
jgi:hypothetical protein